MNLGLVGKVFAIRRHTDDLQLFLEKVSTAIIAKFPNHGTFLFIDIHHTVNDQARHILSHQSVGLHGGDEALHT